jgi:hypothetical protein
LTTDADGVRRQRAGPFISKGVLRRLPLPSRRGLVIRKGPGAIPPALSF